jgi:hypothetical protein
MNRRLLAACGALACGAGMASAQCPCACPLPTTVMPPVELFRLMPPGAMAAPDVSFPGPTLFRKEIAPPVWTEGRPCPPVVLFHKPPPEVALFTHPWPQVVLFRKEATPPCPPTQSALPPISVFAKHPLPPEWAPTVRRPSVTIWHQPPPPCAEEECLGR